MPGTPGQRPRALPVDYFYGFAPLGVAETVIATVPASRVGDVGSIVVYNSTAAGRTVTLHVRQAPAGVVDAAAATNEIMNEVVPAHGRVILGGTKLLTLPEGCVISGLADLVGVNAWVAGALGDM